jgi:long-chain acyl-CoA synthetase
MHADLRDFGWVLSRNAREWPGQIGAISVDSGARLTWAELEARANGFGHALAASGVTGGDRVVLVSENRHEYAEVLFGAAKLGAPLVNLNFRMSAPEMANVLRETEPSAFVVTERFANVIAELDRIGEALPELVVCVGDGPARTVTYEDFLEGSPTTPPRPPQPIDAGDPLTIAFSSGTTGTPKGVIWTHRGVMVNSLTFAYNFRLHTGMRLMMGSALSAHCGMLVIGAYAGCPLVFANFDNESILDAIESTETQYLNLVPTLIERLCDAQEREQRDLSSLTDIVYGGSPISRETVIRATDVLKVRFRQIYSLTEGCMAGCMLDPEDHLAHDTDAGRRRLVSAGRRMHGVDVRVFDEGAPASRGSVGEVGILSEGSSPGYWNDEERTDRLVRGGWVMTGDLGYEDEDGYLFIVDRSKDMIVSGSSNVYAIEVERVLESHPAVREVAVFGVPDEKWGESVHATVVLEPGVTVGAEELLDFCRPLLGGPKRPRSMDFASDLPRNALGKVVKRQLRDPYWAGRERMV